MSVCGLLSPWPNVSAVALQTSGQTAHHAQAAEKGGRGHCRILNDRSLWMHDEKDILKWINSYCVNEFSSTLNKVTQYTVI